MSDARKAPRKQKPKRKSDERIDVIDHPPIIITGGSTGIDFDTDTGAEMYTADHPTTPTKHTGRGLKINSVTVFKPRYDQNPHDCPVPANGLCTILIVAKSGSSDPIVVTGKAGDIVEIGFDSRKYPKQTSRNGRKKFKGVHKIKSLTIIDSSGGVLHVCDHIPANGKCHIHIKDAHIHLESET